MLQDEVLTWVTRHNFQIRSCACSFLPFFIVASPLPLSSEEIQTFSGLLHKEFHIYCLLIHVLLAVQYNFEENTEERGLLWSKLPSGMSTDDKIRSFIETSGLFKHSVLNSIAE